MNAGDAVQRLLSGDIAEAMRQGARAQTLLMLEAVRAEMSHKHWLALQSLTEPQRRAIGLWFHHSLNLLEAAA